ncbi:hypothetical protein TH63_11615 [Rufibacter radiotolerans]|uniref:Uncharacterized protein n=1 Tax=Rufibacter radiotolerans TaxID=1379910 RepID=A0A0H4VQD1_9BACT|nr:hypothetical protein [Rufibacter radiotolerans]AKQ46132.1 hypothetical protein TH63_11615 [Rufibacter radiotolerans]
MSQHTKYLVTTTDGQEFDLTFAKELRSNNLFPFGLHNYAIYRTPEGVYVKGTNSGNDKLMLDQYEVMEEGAAQAYKHPHYRIEEE